MNFNFQLLRFYENELHYLVMLKTLKIAHTDLLYIHIISAIRLRYIYLKYAAYLQYNVLYKKIVDFEKCTILHILITW